MSGKKDFPTILAVHWWAAHGLKTWATEHQEDQARNGLICGKLRDERKWHSKWKLTKNQLVAKNKGNQSWAVRTYIKRLIMTTRRNNRVERPVAILIALKWLIDVGLNVSQNDRLKPLDLATAINRLQNNSKPTFWWIKFISQEVC